MVVGQGTRDNAVQHQQRQRGWEGQERCTLDRQISQEGAQVGSAARRKLCVVLGSYTQAAALPEQIHKLETCAHMSINSQISVSMARLAPTQATDATPPPVRRQGPRPAGPCPRKSCRLQHRSHPAGVQECDRKQRKDYYGVC